jgi:hypothetical protein
MDSRSSSTRSNNCGAAMQLAWKSIFSFDNFTTSVKCAVASHEFEWYASKRQMCMDCARCIGLYALCTMNPCIHAMRDGVGAQLRLAAGGSCMRASAAAFHGPACMHDHGFPSSTSSALPAIRTPFHPRIPVSSCQILDFPQASRPVSC